MITYARVVMLTSSELSVIDLSLSLRMNYDKIKKRSLPVLIVHSLTNEMEKEKKTTFTPIFIKV